jgi:hypothetical protein
MLSASLVGYAIGGAFLSVTYYPHMLVLSGLFVAATSIYEREREAMRKGGEETQEYGSKGRLHGCREKGLSIRNDWNKWQPRNRRSLMRMRTHTLPGCLIDVSFVFHNLFKW